RSSAFIWRAGRRQIANFPDCPADLSEPQYANLVFYPHFQVCVLRITLQRALGPTDFRGVRKKSQVCYLAA
ncbi:hypothetical protein P692DRAFT_20713409, partial [Suillus brevipes Sb2]